MKALNNFFCKFFCAVPLSSYTLIVKSLNQTIVIGGDKLGHPL